MSTPTRYLRHIFLLSASLNLVAACHIDDTQSDLEAHIVSRHQPLIGGSIDTEDPAVVALTYGGESSFCTGTLVSPRVILTAAHCIDMLGSDPNAAVYFGSDTRGEGKQITVRTKKQHPLWTGDLAGGHDVGMMVMDFPYEDPSQALELNTKAPASEHINQPYRHVGFGVYDRQTGQADGKKRTGTTTITGTQGDVILSGDENLSVCFGDSGGPAFLTIDGKEVIAGIHSFTTSDDCFAPNGDTNVQMYAEDFILPWIQDNDPSCDLDGVCGPIGCEADPDCLPCGPDGTCVEDCELPDPDCTTQGVGEICRANSQCVSDLCAAYRGDPDYRFCTEPCQQGNDTCSKGLSCQEIIPFGNICYYDKRPPGALGDSCEEHAECGSYKCEGTVCVVPCDLSVGLNCPEDFSCASEDEGQNYFCYQDASDAGCRISGSGSFSGLYLVLLGLWMAQRRRRQSATH